MIFVCWPPGCYGSYVMHCIYAYSNLGYTCKKKFTIQNTGSSHDFRNSIERKQYFEYGHDIRPNFEKYIIINPSVGHSLDYYNNQLVKQESNNIIQSFKNSFPNAWNTNFLINWHSTEVWALREWASFWLPAQLKNTYASRADATLETQDLFNTTHDIIAECICQLGLTLVESAAKMQSDKLYWISLQKFHNSQKNCENYVKQVLSGIQVKSPCQTVLDEAYVQLLLRENYYEIKCDGLNTFPSSSMELREIIYETSNSNC